MSEPKPIREIDTIGSNKWVLEEETYSIIGSAMDVYYKLGEGFLEPVYQEALAYDFGLRGIPFEEQKKLLIFYKDHQLNKGYYADFLVSVGWSLRSRRRSLCRQLNGPN